MEGTVREAIHRLKYNNLRAIAPALGGLLAEFLDSQQMLGPAPSRCSGQVPSVGSGQVLVPVPLHRRRERQRGYNQAHLLAKEVGDRLGIPLVPQVLSRLGDTPPQAKSPGAQERRANVLGSFRSLHPSQVKGMEVVLVDDVCTTGATLEACAIALKEAGAVSVWGVTLAREA
ncbi:MAG: ComF family protein [Chloroflexi bacterium]|nr:ComF family protein [Chloroflexota bacterium]